ncbi:alpha/beta hydrolase [Labedella endophytica]|uniref:alpha/beta hydrolase n=1 Tax=Labedella endophytica TaxID=1523160 RepID=UPI001FB828E2|nr:alpha/beta hydrolase [Labedella endophytica]
MTAATTDTVVLVHGLWMTPRSWEHWVPYYEAKGYHVVTPAYPGFEIEVEELRKNPDIIANLSVPAVVEHLAAIIAGLDTPPIIMGHSFGGTLTQLLLARGLGSAGVVIDSAPTEGVRMTPLSQARSLFPALKNPANIHKAVAFTQEEFHYAFTNTLSR